jgi:hypothetical protein
MHRTHSPWLFLLSLTVAACGGETTTPPSTKVPITFETATLPNGQQGVAYSAEIRAKGGSGEDFRWSVIGALPSGLFMSSRGSTATDGTHITTILGTPGANGKFTFDVRLTDETGETGTQTLSIDVDPPPPALGITTPSLPEGGTDTAYSADITAENGVPPYTWTLVAGALPPGITLAAEGAPSTTLSGTPVEAGDFQFTVRVRDSENAQADKGFTLSIADTTLPLEFATTDLDDGEVALEYTAELIARNGVPPYTWTLVGDSPPGLAIDDSVSPAVLTGLPTANGSYTFQIEVEDTRHMRVRRTFFVEIARAPPPVRLLTVELPGGEAGTPYSQDLRGLNGTGPYTWTVQGNLPPGLTLTQDASDGLMARIAGTPTMQGTFNFGVQLADRRGDTSQVDYRVVILPQTFPIEIVNTSTTTTAVLPEATVNGLYSTTLTARFGFGRYHWVVTQGALPAGLTLQVAGQPSTVISGRATVSGTFTFSVTVYDDNNETDTQAYELTVIGGGT